MMPPSPGRWLGILLALNVALPVASAQSQVRAAGPSYAITAIAPSLQITPDFTLTTGVTKRFNPQKWLEIEVQFSAPTTPPSGPAAPAVALSELTFRYYVLLANNKLLTGEVTHVDVLGGPELFSVLYVAPRSLALLLGGRPFNSADITNIEIQMLKPGVGAPLAVRMFKPGAALSTSTFQQIPGLLLNKSQTPFAPLYWDRYEAIKTTR
jgi:hypothetical protein